MPPRDHQDESSPDALEENEERRNDEEELRRLINLKFRLLEEILSHIHKMERVYIFLSSMEWTGELSFSACSFIKDYRHKLD